jgi:hypothetical protein
MFASVDKLAAIERLYNRIETIAKAMSGVPCALTAYVGFPADISSEPILKDTPALVAKMPNDFRVEFVPDRPLIAPGELQVWARRIHSGSRKTDMQFHFVSNGWQTDGSPLSDEQIRACLTPDGPPPAAF